MYLIKNANLIGMADINYEVVDILVDGKVIKQIGKLNEKDFKGVKVIDAEGNYVTPGVVTHIVISVSLKKQLVLKELTVMK